MSEPASTGDPLAMATVGQLEEETRAAPVPEALNRNLRCCIPCRLVKTLEQFYDQGCENCTFLDMEGDRERIEDCTTTEFHVRCTHSILLFSFLSLGHCMFLVE
jgi:hypothetical protein